jgi:phosphoribosylformylglycinamidine (FGAM) synthase-like enzyme
LKSAHDCSEGGLAVALAESCFSSNGREAVGATLTLATDGLAAESLLFGEVPSRIVISYSPDDADRVRQIILDCPFAVIGTVADDIFRISVDGEQVISSPVSDLEMIWESALAESLA